MKEKFAEYFFSYDSSNTDKGIAKVGFYTYDEKLLYEYQCQLNTSIKDVINNFVSNNSYILIQNSLNYNNLSFYIKSSQIFQEIDSDNRLVLSLLTNYQVSTVVLMQKNLDKSNKNSKDFQSSRYLKIYVQNEKRFNHLSDNMDEYIIKNTNFIGKPIINELKYFIFNKNTQETKIVKLTKEDRNKTKIKYFSRMSVYCNAKNYIYIYEGIADFQNSNNSFKNNSLFLNIDLINHKVNIISRNFPDRVLHSMIFVPESYIFIVGGKDTRKVLVYIMNKDNDKYEEYTHLLPYELLEPSLIILNNEYLYAFENSSFRFHIIRTNINLVKPFEEIKINSININQKFFGLIKIEESKSILFLGGQFLSLHGYDNKKCFEFNYEKNNLYLTDKEVPSFDFDEKTFIPMKKNEYMQIVETKSESENKYKQKVVLYKSFLENESQSVEVSNNFQGQARFKAGGFQSIDSGQKIQISVDKNIISLTATTSFGEIAVPLYNNK